MKRKIIKIDEEKCNGCGACAKACHEGAIGMINGKAKLLRDDYCDGLGDCLPACPTDAISFEEREAAAYDEEAVKKRKAIVCDSSGCSAFNKPKTINNKVEEKFDNNSKIESELKQWPIQIKLAPLSAPFYQGAKLLIAADCTAFSYGNFHRDYMKGKITLIGCTKLDSVDYTEKLTAIIKNNDIKSVTVVKMEVPCCSGMANCVKNALINSGKFIPWQVVTISTEGKILE